MLTPYLQTLFSGQSLTAAAMGEAMEAIIASDVPAVQVGALLAALRMKGETVAELLGAARALRRHAAFIDTGSREVIDTAGTGGDHAATFNVSTAAAFVAAAAGVPVAKHGNRSVSSKCGSADVLAALGFNLDVEPAVMEEAIQRLGIGFLFAAKLHPALGKVAGLRRELKQRTIFNMLGPLLNPAGATGQLMGCYAPELTEVFAGVLRELGVKRAMVVHGLDALDEITVTAPTRVSELKDGMVTTYELRPEILIGQSYDPADIVGGDAAVNAEIMRLVLQDRAPKEAMRAITVVNAGAAIYVGGQCEDIAAGIRRADEALASGAAYRLLEELIRCSHA